MEIFLRYWSYVRGIHRSTVVPRTKASDVVSFDVFFDLRLSQRLCKHAGGLWFETTFAHYDVIVMTYNAVIPCTLYIYIYIYDNIGVTNRESTNPTTSIDY